MNQRTGKRPSAAITGAGGGLGRDIALGLARKGYRVFGTALSPEEVETVGFPAKGQVKRSDFGLGFGAPAVSDTVDLEITAAFEKTPG
jgi:NAD(P)-dependent dehydrogenase (short-subunit alcohol dehydrogenase family)